MDQNVSPLANILLDWKILLGFGFLGFVSAVNAKIAILPVSSLTFILISICVWFISLCTTFFYLHKLLQRNEPLRFNLHSNKQLQSQEKRELKPVPGKVQQLTEDIEKHFINKWYNNISKDGSFPEESKHLLNDIINRLSEVQLCVSNKLLLHGVLNIYLKHLKEFRRSLRRKEKYNGAVEELYRYSHLCSNSSKKAKDYFIHQLTVNVLKHFINSELWNSLPCTVLVSILSRKLTSYLLKLASNPEIINFLLLYSIASKSVKDKYNLSSCARICISQYYDLKNSTENHLSGKSTKEQVDNGKDSIDGDSTKVESKIYVTREENLAKICEKLDSKMNSLSFSDEETLKTDEHKGKTSLANKKIEHASEHKDHISPSKHTSSDPVKIYEPKSSNINKTWRDSKDLGYGISLGQDPLDAFPIAVENIKTVGKSTFWDTGKIEHFVEDSPLLNEMKLTTQTTMEGLKSSIKPISDATVHTLHNIKDLQESTVNNALHKIGDFQDEAAGVVEGILDFGRAGLRRGLRLTGLHDNIENAKACLNVKPQVKPRPKRRPVKAARVESPEKILPKEDEIDSVWMNPLQMDSPSFDGQILLEKSRKFEDSEEKELQIPFISMEQPPSDTNSPDPQYEDTADLASSIAKLRSLLQQRSSESSISTPALSPIPPDEFGQKISENENVSDVDETEGVTSYFKFCAKTATGVFDKTLNTIKTALPSSVQIEHSDNAWIFIQAEQNEADILTRMKKLLTERKEYCTLDTEIDTADEAIDSMDIFQQPVCSSHVAFEDELDDFEVMLPLTKAVVDIFCELLTDTDTPFVQEPVVKAFLLTMGNSLEKCIMDNVDKAMENICMNLIRVPEKSNQNTLYLDMDVYIEAVLSSFPDAVKLVLGKETLRKSLILFISSLQVQKINQDVVLQMFELIALKLIEESSQLSPPASA